MMRGTISHHCRCTCIHLKFPLQPHDLVLLRCPVLEGGMTLKSLSSRDTFYRRRWLNFVILGTLLGVQFLLQGAQSVPHFIPLWHILLVVHRHLCGLLVSTNDSQITGFVPDPLQ